MVGLEASKTLMNKGTYQYTVVGGTFAGYTSKVTGDAASVNYK